MQPRNRRSSPNVKGSDAAVAPSPPSAAPGDAPAAPGAEVSPGERARAQIPAPRQSQAAAVEPIHGWPSRAQGPGEPSKAVPGEPGEGEPAAAPAVPAARPTRPRPAQPSWGTVLATTIRLWGQRRLRPLARRLRAVTLTWRVVALIAAAAVFVAGAITVSLSTGATPAPAPRQGPRSPAASPAASDLTGAATARQDAAQWAVHQVSADAVVACDPAMCAALQQQGVAAGRLLVLGPAQADPLGSGIVMATPAVRALFGSRLASVYAPVIVAGFGSGPSRIDIRVTAPFGAAAYESAFAADMRARQAAGAQLARNPRIRVSKLAARQLRTGHVDSRLLVTLATFAGLHPVYVAKFGDLPGPGTTPGVPLRSADIAPRRGGSLAVMRRFFGAQRPPYRPSLVEALHAAPRRTMLRVLYPAPAPLRLLSSRS